MGGRLTSQTTPRRVLKTHEKAGVRTPGQLNLSGRRSSDELKYTYFNTYTALALCR